MTTPVQKNNTEATPSITSISVTLGSAPVSGNVLICAISVDKDSGTLTQPAGFSTPTIVKSSTSVTLAVCYKVSAGNETSALTWSWTTEALFANSWVAEYDNIISIAPDVSIITNNSGATSQQNLTTGTSGTTTQDDTFAVALFAADSISNAHAGQALTNSFLIEQSMPVGTTSGSPMLLVGTKDLTAAGTVETTFSTTSGGDEIAAILIVFKAVTAPATAAIDFYLSSAQSTTAAVNCRIPSGLSTTLEYATNISFTSSSATTAQTAISSDDYIATFLITGLTAGTQYYYRAIEDGVTDTRYGAFKTMQPSGTAQSFSFAFASCGETGVNSITYQNIADASVDFVLHTGDLHYEDIITNTESDYWTAFKTQFGMARFRAMFENHATAYIWDDHDFGPDDSGSSHTGKVASAAAHRRYFPQSLNNTSGSIERSFTFGRVKFILLDTRYFRAGTTFLGAAQLAWLKTELTDSADTGIRLTVVSTGVPWIASSGADTWTDASAERTEISDHIFAENLENKVAFICGDAHMVAFDDGTNNDFDTLSRSGWPVVQSAPFSASGSTKGGPYTTAAIQGDANGQYSIMSITDDGVTLSATVTAYNSSDVAIQSNAFDSLTANTASFTLTGGESLSAQDYLLLNSQELTTATVLTQGSGETTTAGGVLEISWQGSGVVNGQAVYGLIAADDESGGAILAGTVAVS